MSDLHRHVLRKNQRYLLNNIIINEDFYAELINNDLINDSMLEDIRVCRMDSEKIARLLDMLPRRGPRAFDNFVTVLLKTSHPDPAKKLKASEATERFRRCTRKELQWNITMTEKLVDHHNKSNQMLDQFYTQKQDIALSKQKVTTDQTTKEEAQRTKQQKLLDRCTQLTSVLATKLCEAVNTPPDLTEVQKMLDQYKDDTMNGKLDGFYSNVQSVLTYLGKHLKSKESGTETGRGGLKGNDGDTSTGEIVGHTSVTWSPRIKKQANIFKIKRVVHGTPARVKQGTTVRQPMYTAHKTTSAVDKTQFRPSAAPNKWPTLRPTCDCSQKRMAHWATPRDASTCHNGRRESQMNSFEMPLSLLPPVPCQMVQTIPYKQDRLGPRRFQRYYSESDAPLQQMIQQVSTANWTQRKQQE
ncbi:hypothetical protein LSAT2_032163 [Lamellibrachia satsuma]|nr:hypothetical protein LSAT2_032163 [Lamellibrachia satsuma]